MPLTLPLLALMAAPAPAATWLLDMGLSAGVGASRIVGDPSPAFAGSGPFASSPHDGGAGTGLAGSVGLAAGLARAGGLRLSAELGLGGADGVVDVLYHLPGLDLRKVSRYSLSGPRLTLAAGWALPSARLGGTRLDPRLMLGGYYEHFTSRDLNVAVDGGDPQALGWPGAPADDAGWLLGVGLDLRDARPQQWFPRVALDLRWRRGHASLDPARGVDAPLQAFEAVLTVPVRLQAW